MRQLSLAFCILWDNWAYLGLSRQVSVVSAGVLTVSTVLVLIKLAYWYVILSCGWLDPVFWLYGLLEHWYNHREYGEWHNMYSAYMFSLGLLMPLITYFFCWYTGFWLLEHSSEGSVVRPYPFTEFELRLGVTFEELYLIVWAWFMNLLAVSQGIWYNPADDVVGPYYRTP